MLAPYNAEKATRWRDELDTPLRSWPVATLNRSDRQKGREAFALQWESEMIWNKCRCRYKKNVDMDIPTKLPKHISLLLHLLLQRNDPLLWHCSAICLSTQNYIFQFRMKRKTFLLNSNVRWLKEDRNNYLSTNLQLCERVLQPRDKLSGEHHTVYIY